MLLRAAMRVFILRVVTSIAVERLALLLLSFFLLKVFPSLMVPPLHLDFICTSHDNSRCGGIGSLMGRGVLLLMCFVNLILWLLLLALLVVWLLFVLLLMR